MLKRVLTVFGTRPEAIKLAPVVRAFETCNEVVHATCVTGQHREMLDQVLETFQIQPRFDLAIMRDRQTLEGVTSAVLGALKDVISEFQPDWLVVQGDTTTAFAAALAGFYAKVAVAHVEAGLRTGNIMSPWPEEMNRRMISCLARLHMAPTAASRDNLLREGIAADNIEITGNTVIDALRWIQTRQSAEQVSAAEFATRFGFARPTRRVILVTGHRRENFEGGLAAICTALRRLALRDDVEIVYPVHLNPNVRSTVYGLLADSPRVHLVPPLDYLSFVYLMSISYLIVTDSGGIQEEAPSLGKPVLVTRDTTERREAVDAGVARLVGTDEESLFQAVSELLDDDAAYGRMSTAANPFGDGHASQRIVHRILRG